MADIGVALPIALFTAPLCLALTVIASRSTGETGLFRQARIGRHGRTFDVYKVRTMRSSDDHDTVTIESDPRITPAGARIRRWKLDELPQLWNVLAGDMSLVGPRPDVAGYADELHGDDRDMLRIRPGITGPATLVFRHEESYLSVQSDPSHTNDAIIWPAKVRINCLYARHGTLRDDVALLVMTLRGNDDRLKEMMLRWDATVCADHPVIDHMISRSRPTHRCGSLGATNRGGP